MGWRTLAEVGSTFCFLTALFNMPIADATAILQSVPLAVALGAAVFLGEPVGWRRYLAIGVGFVGVLIIVRPGGEGFNAYALWALGAVGFIVLRDLSTRRLSPDVPSLQISVLAAAGITVSAGAIALVTEWHPVSAAHLGVLFVAAVEPARGLSLRDHDDAGGRDRLRAAVPLHAAALGDPVRHGALRRVSRRLDAGGQRARHRDGALHLPPRAADGACGAGGGKGRVRGLGVLVARHPPAASLSDRQGRSPVETCPVRSPVASGGGRGG
jgi:hypothetical protein